MFNKLTVCGSSATAVNFLIIIAIVIITMFEVIFLINLNELWSSLGDFCKLLRDWGLLVGDQILKGSTWHIMAKEVVFVVIISGEDEFLSHRDSGILDEVNETFLGDILTIKNTNLGSLRWSMLLEGLSGVSEITIVIIRESFVKGSGQMSIVWGNLYSGIWCWQPSNHHANSDVIVIIWILGLMSIFTEN